jgi:hypothetical protein
MTRRRRRGSSHGGHGGKRSGRGHGRGQNYTGTRMVANSGLCAALVNNVFDYGHRAATDQMRTSWEKLIQFVGTNYGQDISNELQNKIPVILSEPVHTPEVLARHAICEQMVQTREENLQQACLSKLQLHLELTQMHQCNLRFWIMKLQKEITNKTMRSQSKCWIHKRHNTASIGEPTKRGTRY